MISHPAPSMGLRRPPYAFTQEGVAMLSTVLRSKRAVQTSIAIIRAFVRAGHETAHRLPPERRIELSRFPVHIRRLNLNRLS